MIGTLLGGRCVYDVTNPRFLRQGIGSDGDQLTVSIVAPKPNPTFYPRGTVSGEDDMEAVYNNVPTAIGTLALQALNIYKPATGAQARWEVELISRLLT